MHQSSKNILLISYVFPPYYGIGGRRWAKHASELTKLGYTIHVICAKNPFKEKSLWTDIVINNPNIIVHQISSMFPNVLVMFNHNFFQKLLYKFWIKILPFLTKGSYLDRTIFWKRKMLNKAKQLIIEHKIKHVICSGAPFGAMYQTTLLKKWFNDLFVMNDFRDPWTWGPNWGFPDLEAKRMEYESFLEYKTIEDSDIISVPTLEMKTYMDKKYPGYSHKIKIIHHFFDKSEITVSEKTKSSKIRLILYGNIYHHIPYLIEEAANVLAKFKDKITLDIYTDKIQHKKTFDKHNATNVTFHEQLPAPELFKLFKNYDYVFLMVPSVGVDHISTKFYEIIHSKTPFFIFCKYGLGPKFILDNNLGIHAEINNLENVFNELIEKKQPPDFNFNFDIEPYSLESNARQISEIFENSNKVNTIKGDVKNLLFTFDYELYLGYKSGTIENCIIGPTNDILNLLNKYNIKKCIFFIDTVYLMRLVNIDDNSAREDYKIIFDQLIQILKKGHYIFPHIHPHWVDAKYVNSSKQWILNDLSKYRFHNTSYHEKELLFDKSIKFIKDVQNKANIFYDIDAYRAGGWCIQPFSDFEPFFEKYNIKYDFSVLSGFKILNDKFYYNFSNFPKQKIYKFNSHIERQEDGGKFTEFSITNIALTKQQRIKNKFFLKVLYKLNYQNFGDGLAIMKPEDKIIINDSFVRNSDKNIEMTSIELLTIPKLKLYKRFVEKNSYVHFITHPKMLNKHNIFCFEQYLKFVYKNYKIETDYKKMTND